MQDLVSPCFLVRVSKISCKNWFMGGINTSIILGKNVSASRQQTFFVKKTSIKANFWVKNPNQKILFFLKKNVIFFVFFYKVFWCLFESYDVIWRLMTPHDTLWRIKTSPLQSRWNHCKLNFKNKNDSICWENQIFSKNEFACWNKLDFFQYSSSSVFRKPHFLKIF